MESVNMLFEPVRLFLGQIGAFLPRLLLALVVLVGGWLLAKVARFAVARGLRAINVNVLTERAGLDAFLRQGGMQGDTCGLLGWLVYWVVILAALIVAFNGLGLTYVTDLLSRVLLFVPNVFVGLLILAFGSYFARFVGDAVQAYCRSVGIREGGLLGKFAQYAIMAFVVLITLEQLNIGGNIVRISFLILIGGIVLALALAFGLGGRDLAARMLERWAPKDRKDPGGDSRF